MPSELIAAANAALLESRQHGRTLLDPASRPSLDEGPPDALSGAPSSAASGQGSMKRTVAGTGAGAKSGQTGFGGWRFGLQSAEKPAGASAGTSDQASSSQQSSDPEHRHQHRMQHYRGDPALNAALHGLAADGVYRAGGSNHTAGHPGLSQHGAAPHAHGRMPAAAVRRVELVLLHTDAPGSFPQDTAAWLGKRAHLARHHHVRLNRQADTQR